MSSNNRKNLLSCFDLMSSPWKRLLSYKKIFGRNRSLTINGENTAAGDPIAALQQTLDPGSVAAVNDDAINSAADNTLHLAEAHGSCLWFSNPNKNHKDPARLELESTINQLVGRDVQEAAFAAVRLFEKIHAANPRHPQNKILLLESGAVPMLLNLTKLSTPDRVRHHVCCIISELAFQDPISCKIILAQPGLAERMGELLQPLAGRTQEDAARIINNLAAFSNQAAPLLARCGSVLDGLAGMATRDLDAQHIAVGAINSLSRCEGARSLLSTRAIFEALAAALDIAGEDDRQAATRASAAMALANLTGDFLPVSAAAHPRHHALAHASAASARPGSPDAPSSACIPESAWRHLASLERVLGDVVELLDLAIQGRKRRGVLFRPYSVLHPLQRLARLPANRGLLVSLGVPRPLHALLESAADGSALAVSAAERDVSEGAPGRCLHVAMSIVEELAADPALRPALRDAGLASVLRRLGEGGGDAAAAHAASLPCHAAHVRPSSEGAAASSSPAAAAAARAAFGKPLPPPAAATSLAPSGEWELAAAAAASPLAAAAAGLQERAARAAEAVVAGRLALAMAQHPRLGRGSRLAGLDADLLQLVAQWL